MSRFKYIFHSTYEERFKINNVFFLKYLPYSYFDREGNEVDVSKWVSVDRDLNISFEAKQAGLDVRNYHLCIVELDSKQPHKDDHGAIIADRFEYQVHIASLQSENDLMRLFTLSTYKIQRHEKNYAFLELLWLLNAYSINDTTFKNALSKVGLNTAQWVCNGIVDFGRSLSIRKQKQLKEIVATYGYTFHVYDPNIIKDAISRINFNRDFSFYDKNVYEIVDAILNHQTTFNPDNTGGNMLLELQKWFNNTEPFLNYAFLANLYALVDEPVRLSMLKRWFNDIRLGNTTFDENLLQQFKDNKFDNFVRFRHCIEHPGEPIVLTVPLLADNILTLKRSNGANFQSFDGILDFAITHCDTSHPTIDFSMDRFLPTCNGGTQRNENFAGFVDYALVRKLDETKFTHEYVLPVIRRLLDTFAQRKSYTACMWNREIPLTEEQLRHCLKKRHLPNREQNPFHRLSTYQFECAITCHYEDKWLVKHNDDFDFNVMFVDSVKLSREETEVDISMVSTDKFIEFLRLIPTRFATLDDGEFVVPSYRQRSLLLSLVEEFSTIERMRIYPNKTVYAGLEFDIFGIRKRICEEHDRKEENKAPSFSHDAKEIAEKYAKEEAEEVHKRVLKSLKTNYNLGEYNEEENFFETKFKRSLLAEIVRKYYFKQSVTENTNRGKLNFLESKASARFKPFCSPNLAKVKNEILDFPYFWCRGNECFHNCLGEQTLAEISEWQRYSMYHMIEIIGFPKLHKTEAGYEPSTEVIQFIAVANKAMQKFRRLKCRVCGHLLFTAKSIGFNRNNYYACGNPNCSEFNHPVYLSYCFKCKKGLIDSRDSARCPNGWYICPDCLSCCDDDQYERLAQRYVVSKLPIPQRIKDKLGQGHNDKGIHYCPKCGSQIIQIQDEHGDFHNGCPQCRIKYVL